MSHLYYLACDKCNESTEAGFNHAREKLIRAVETSYGLWLLKGTEWDIANLDYDCLPNIARFIVAHFGCDEFFVVSEYWREDRPERDPRVKVRPIVPDTFPSYLGIALDTKMEEAKRIGDKLAALIAEFQGVDSADASTAKLIETFGQDAADAIRSRNWPQTARRSQAS